MKYIKTLAHVIYFRKTSSPLTQTAYSAMCPI